MVVHVCACMHVCVKRISRAVMQTGFLFSVSFCSVGTIAFSRLAFEMLLQEYCFFVFTLDLCV